MNGIERFDVVEGVVINTNRKGAIVKIENLDCECYCKCCMQVGDRALFTIVYFYENNNGKSAVLKCDSILEYAALAS